jgi:glycosyltransferase involved in cell wall biosynthesis
MPLRGAAAHIRDRIGRVSRRRRRLPPALDPVPTISVVVPTLARPQLLRRCLDALARQTVPPEQVVVAYRPDDRDTVALLREWEAADPGRRTPTVVSEPGLLHALAAGTNAATAEVVAYVDDDGAPRPDWIAELGRGFTDPRVGAVGGRILDRVNGEVVRGRVRRPGLIRWYGRIVWGHNGESDHYGDVDWLSGSNVSIRRHLVQIDTRLLHQPNGLAMANDLDTTLSVRRSGFRVLFGSHIVVEHDTTSHRDPLLGSRVSLQDVERSAANHAYALLKYMPRSRHPFLFLWGYLMGSRSMAGPGRVLIELSRSPRRAVAMARRVPHVWKGRRLGARMYREWRVRGSEPPVSRERSAVDVGAARNSSA